MNPLPGDSNLAAGLRQQDIDRAYDGYGGRHPVGDAEKHERELERAERRRDAEIERELATPKPPAPGAVTPDALIIAFTQGAQWWEHYKTGATMWASDRDIAEAEAKTRTANGTLGKLPNYDKS